MSDNEMATSGATVETSGSAKNTESATSGADKSTYDSDFVQKLKKEKDNWKAKAEELALKSKAEHEDKLKSQMQFKELYESQKKATEEALAQKRELEAEITKTQIAAKVRGELAKLGMAQEYAEDAFRLMDWKLVSLDPETKTVIGAEEAAKAFHERYNGLGFFKKGSAGVNHNAPQNGKAPDIGLSAELKTVKNQKELESVLKKHGMV